MCRGMVQKRLHHFYAASQSDKTSKSTGNRYGLYHTVSSGSNRDNTKGLLWDSNCDKEYLDKPYDPKFVVVDDQSLEEDAERAENRRSRLEANSLVHFIEGDMMDHSVVDRVRDNGPYDLVWFDCGGPVEYQHFVDYYWDMVKEYALFHFTYFRGEPNKNNSILSTITDISYRMDIVEPHKLRQGSITMLRKIV